MERQKEHMKPLARKALDAIRERGKAAHMDLIETAISEINRGIGEKIVKEESHGKIIKVLLEINRVYSDVRGRVKDTLQWKTLLEIEREINRAALEDDFEGLAGALQAYKEAVLGIEHEEIQGNLFQGLKNEQDEPGSDRG